MCQLSLAFRDMSSFWHLEPSFHLAFGATIFLQFWRSKLSCILIQAFRVIIFPHFGVQSHSSSPLSFRVMTPDIPIHWHYASTFMVLCSSLVFPHLVTLYLSLIHHVPLDFPFPLHMTWSIEFMTHISITLLSTLHLVFSCSSHRAILFGRILTCTRMWFDHYSSLTLTIESLLETSQRKSRSLM